MRLALERRSERIAFLFLLGALLTFLAMHAMPVAHHLASGPGESVWVRQWGYEMWSSVIPSAGDLRNPELPALVISAGFLLFSALVVVAPSLVGSFARSRVLWWTAVVCSAAALGTIDGILGYMIVGELRSDPWWRPGAGLVPFLAAPPLNFIGLLCIRKADQDPPPESS